MKIHTNRSWLYVPGSAGDRLQRAGERGADALIVDLEDAVAPGEKDAARVAVAAWVHQSPSIAAEIWVRINTGQRGLGDAGAVVAAALVGVFAPKVESLDELEALDAVLHAAERSNGIEPGTIGVCPLVESATGLEALHEIVRAPRVRQLQIGEIDLAADLGLSPQPDGLELLAIRTQVVIASRAAGLPAPMGAVLPNFRDLDVFRADSERLQRLGFWGRACIHPAQLPIVHELCTPSADQVDAARDVLRRFDDALARGEGAALDEHGQMLDEATVRAARHTLSLARPTAAG
jgi:citrate lyase subunit beta/citryl-CoA lyase